MVASPTASRSENEGDAVGGTVSAALAALLGLRGRHRAEHDWQIQHGCRARTHGDGGSPPSGGTAVMSGWIGVDLAAAEEQMTEHMARNGRWREATSGIHGG